MATKGLVIFNRPPYSGDAEEVNPKRSGRGRVVSALSEREPADNGGDGSLFRHDATSTHGVPQKLQMRALDSASRRTAAE